MAARFIYRDRSDDRFYDASTREMRGGPDKVIVYIDGVLCAMDRTARVVIPASRWQLALIGLACLKAAFGGKGAPRRPLESAPLPEPGPDALPLERPPEAAGEESSQAQWERLMREMRDLSR